MNTQDHLDRFNTTIDRLIDSSRNMKGIHFSIQCVTISDCLYCYDYSNTPRTVEISVNFSARGGIETKKIVVRYFKDYFVPVFGKDCVTVWYNTGNKRVTLRTQASKSRDIYGTCPIEDMDCIECLQVFKEECNARQK